MQALSTAATGMKAMESQVSIIANNLANVDTNGFKRARALFQDLFYQQIRQPGTISGLGGSTNPSGIQVGLGVQLATTMDVFEQGLLEDTGRPLDVAIRGNGFFQVRVYDDMGSGIGYTRDGAFFTNANGDLVLGGPDGFVLEPNINVPDDVLTLDITPDGRVNVTTAGSPTPQAVGIIELATFINPNGLVKVGSNVYVATEAAGEPQINEPGSGGAGTLLGRFIERSNVDAVRELTKLIQAQRSFELNGRVIETADQMLQVTNRLKA
jgi:flagellar basal-body rod protein FlgG